MTANILTINKLQRCHYEGGATVRYPLSRHRGAQRTLGRASPLLIKPTTIDKLTRVMRQRAETRLVPREGALRQRRRDTVLITTRGALIRTSHDEQGNPHRRHCHRR